MDIAQHDMDMSSYQNSLAEYQGSLGSLQSKKSEAKGKADEFNERLKMGLLPFGAETLTEGIDSLSGKLRNGVSKGVKQGIQMTKDEVGKKLDQASQKIADKYGIDKDRVKNLLKGQVNGNREGVNNLSGTGDEVGQIRKIPPPPPAPVQETQPEKTETNLHPARTQPREQENIKTSRSNNLDEIEARTQERYNNLDGEAQKRSDKSFKSDPKYTEDPEKFVDRRRNVRIRERTIRGEEKRPETTFKDPNKVIDQSKDYRVQDDSDIFDEDKIKSPDTIRNPPSFDNPSEIKTTTSITGRSQVETPSIEATDTPSEPKTIPAREARPVEEGLGKDIETGTETALETDAELGGAEDLVGDVVSLGVGLGAIFGEKDLERKAGDVNQTITNPSSQYGI